MTARRRTTKPGRPTIRSEALALRICALMCEGLSLRAICGQEGMPSRSAVLSWLAEDEEFARQYARACATRADVMAEEILEIADDARNDFVEREAKDGGTELVFDAEHVQRSRLRIDSRKWLMSKLQPKKYGDRLELAPTGGMLQIHIHDDMDEATKAHFRGLGGDHDSAQATFLPSDAERGERTDLPPSPPTRRGPADGGPINRTPSVFGFGEPEPPERSSAPPSRSLPRFAIDDD